jgi:hypothetical protein
MQLANKSHFDSRRADWQTRQLILAQLSDDEKIKSDDEQAWLMTLERTQSSLRAVSAPIVAGIDVKQFSYN